MKRKALSLVLAGVLSASMVIPAFATGGVYPVADGTEIWAGVTLDDPDTRIKVEVPTLFAFVVNGTVTSSDTTSISVTDGSLLLPNVKVNVTTPSVSGADAVYETSVVGNGVMELINYSTQIKDAVTSEREGVAVNINGNVKNEGTELSRNYWTYDPAATSGKRDDFKRYYIGIGDQYLVTPADGGYELAEAIGLTAPNLGYDDSVTPATYTNMNDTTKLAITGTTTEIVFDVVVGGQRGQYTQVEQSAKVGTIVWTVGVATEDDVNTAPTNDYLSVGDVTP